MSSIDMHTKISGHEAFAWIKNCLENHSLLPEDEEQLIDFIVSQKPKDFKNPRKPRASKKSSQERASDDYQPSLCDAMVWNDHLGAQCDKKKVDGKCFCNRHFNENEKHGATRFGIFLINSDGDVQKQRYTHAFNNTEDKIHLWDGVERPKKAKKTSSSTTKGTRKCGICGECGHNRKTCPHRPKEPEDTGAGTGLNLIPSHQEFNQARVNLSDAISGNSNTETQNDTNETQNDTTDSQETVLLLPDPQPEDLDEDLSLDNHDDDDDNSTVMYQGIQYRLDTEDNTIVDDEMDVIGNWDPDTQTIEWINSDISKFHRLAVFELKAKSESKQEQITISFTHITHKRYKKNHKTHKISQKKS